MFNELTNDLQEALENLEYSCNVADYIKVQELLRDIEYNAHKLIVVYVD